MVWYGESECSPCHTALLAEKKIKVTQKITFLKEKTTMTRRGLLVAMFAAILTFSSCAHSCTQKGEEGNKENVEQQEQKYDVYLLIGQSNMAGRGASSTLSRAERQIWKAMK